MAVGEHTEQGGLGLPVPMVVGGLRGDLRVEWMWGQDLLPSRVELRGRVTGGFQEELIFGRNLFQP